MTIRRNAALAVITLCVSAFAFAQPADPAAINWTAPPYWTPPLGQHIARPQAPSAEASSTDRDVSAAATSETPLTGTLPFFAVTPCRLVDTRHTPHKDLKLPGGGTPAGYPRGTFANGEIRSYDLTSSTECTGLPAGVGAWSLVFQFTTSAGSGSYLQAWPYASSLGIGSQVSPTSESTMLGYSDRWTANSAIIPAGDDIDGSINVKVQYAGDVIIEVNGYYGYSGTGNTFIGENAGNVSTGTANTAIGWDSLNQNITGSNNIAVGYDAGVGLTTGKYNIDIGNAGVPGESFTIRIGTPYSSGPPSAGQSSTYIAGISGVAVSGAGVLVSSSGQLGVASSSLRFKEDVADMGDASSGLMELRPVTFHYRTQPDGPLQYGLIAEEVEEVMPELVVKDATGQPETVAYHELPAMLLNELQKQRATIQAQQAQIEGQRSEIGSLKAALAERDRALERRLAALEQNKR